MSDIRCSTINGDTRTRRGRPSDPNALKFRGMGARPRDWEYLAKWQTPEEQAAGNFTPALGRIIEFARTFAPNGQTVGKPRDEKGRFVPEGGTSKAAIYRAKKREKGAGE